METVTAVACRAVGSTELHEVATVEVATTAAAATVVGATAVTIAMVIATSLKVRDIKAEVTVAEAATEANAVAMAAVAWVVEAPLSVITRTLSLLEALERSAKWTWKTSSAGSISHQHVSECLLMRRASLRARHLSTSQTRTRPKRPANWMARRLGL